MTDTEWLQQLKTGDDVFVTQRFGTSQPGKITRTTKAQIFVTTGKNFSGTVDESAFHKKNGRSVGGDVWYSQHLLQPLPELFELAEISRLKTKAKNLRDSLSIPRDKDTLLKFINALSVFADKEKS